MKFYICNNMNELGEYFAKWNKLLYMWNIKKYNKLVNMTKRKRFTDRKKKLAVTNGEREKAGGAIQG